jgi:ParB-like chromosome segregation protein Spo0J
MENNNKIKLCSEIVLMPVEDLVPYQQNAKKHPQRQIDVIKRSFKLTMFDQPIVINKRDSSIIKGHGRLEAAIQLGLSDVPVIILDVPIDVANKARLVDNQSSLMSDNDPDVLLKELMRYEKDIIDTGYREDDLEKLLKSLSFEEVEEVEEVEEEIEEEEDNRANINEDVFFKKDFKEDFKENFKENIKENSTKESSTKEINPDDFSFNHLCPKRGFQFN